MSAAEFKNDKEVSDNTVHVLPVDDLKPHKASKDCWCGPWEEPINPGVFVHNSLDRRELYEDIVN